MTDPLRAAPITEPIASVGSTGPVASVGPAAQPVALTGSQPPDVAGAERRMATVLTVRLVIGVVAALVAIGAAIILFRTGKSTNDFGPFLPDGQPTPVDRYTGPWIVAAAGALLAAGLLLVTATADGIRVSKLRSAAHGGAT